jgi:hypothetical protein
VAFGVLAPALGITGSPRRGTWRQSLVGLTVLVVDNDEGSLDYFAVTLELAGATVATNSVPTSS